VEIAYGLAKEYWGKGLGSEAAAAAMEYGFQQLHLERFVAIARPDNIASQAVMKKLGMRQVKSARFCGGEWVYYVIERKKYQAQSQSRDA